MTYLPPKFWQFYARGVMWAGLVLLPLLILYNYLHSLSYEIMFVTVAVDKIFSFGYFLISLTCGWGAGCIVGSMGDKEAAFFAYFFSVLVIAFFIALYKAWTWSPGSPKTVSQPPKKDEFDY